METLEAQFEAEAQALIQPRFNIAPTTAVPVVRNGPSGRVIVLQTWGLIPSWSRDPALSARLANARAETAADKPSFRGPFRHTRCLIPADGFYEWRAGTPKQPYFIHGAQGEPLALAGLWDRWQGPEGARESCTILTTTPNALMAPIHDRMPVILDRPGQDLWLAAGTATEVLQALLRPCPETWLRLHPVDPRVGKVANDASSLIASYAPGGSPLTPIGPQA